ncbi:MAG: molybdopterin synthase catalytic subunit MoaE [Oceanospirillales bacterium]|uniref:Molybdopterin synthase catalytic subunit n=1 Tax=Marinobacterium halophilum TaxID=267374 RepID=A0A2P8EU99_9GAMM|nr:molybdopterin synthase catalytic subunit MoaE [Marinobacterium halophilum]MBR9829697.1 molybdopterin synthase catalytic subunit MoaE [Oceanospirillales bacterium]PSL13034.1 molybdopterin synthase subunit MoaE [Marinobacterium halophilum]
MVHDVVKVHEEDFDPGQLHAWLKAGEGDAGAIITFTGIVRDLVSGNLEGLYLEHYPGMTEQALAAIVVQARRRWSLGRVVVCHRVGWLQPNDNIVFVGVSSAHRAEGFEAAMFLMDYLKRDAPFWKKERTADGEQWVKQKCTDLAAARRWSESG